MNHNPTCQHHHINNDTHQCSQCNEPMHSVTYNAHTIISAPNAAACTNPQCTGDIDDPNCHNPSGTYIPDIGRQQEITIGYDAIYECQRCPNNGTIYDHTGVTWECGHHHRGAHIPIPERATT